MLRSEAPAKTSSGYMIQLDGLRGIAVALVLIHHFYLPLPKAIGLDFGALGVRLFFVLSGFLITGILLDERARIASSLTTHREVLRRFYFRRTLRIFPIYYLTLFVAAALGNEDVRGSFWWLVTYTSNFEVQLKGYFDWSTAHLWTLAVEEQFYIVWPAIILFAPQRFLGVLIAAVVLIAPAFRAVGLELGFSIGLYVNTLSSLDSLGAGALLAWAGRAGPVWLRPFLERMGLSALFLYGLMIATYALGGNPGLFGIHPFVFEYLLVSFGFLWLVARAADGMEGFAGRVLSARMLVALGRISYGVYLYHLFVRWAWFEAGGGALALPEVALAMVLSALSIGLAMISWVVVEQPLNSLKRFAPYPKTASRSSLQDDAQKSYLINRG